MPMRPEPNPYVGPVPFTEQNKHLFFGRDREAADLLGLVSGYQAVLLYATSGAGKTSLVNAKLIPSLEARKANVLGPVRVSGPLDLLRQYDPPNVFSFYAIFSLQEKLGPERAKSSLCEYLLRDVRDPEDGRPRPLRVLILDQFEELFTKFPERWADRREFFTDLGRALAADGRLRVVFSVREELIARLDPYTNKLPDGLRIRLRLERLDEEAALQAIVNPVRSTSVTYAPGVAEKLVRQLRRGKNDGALSEFIEPLQLQIVCTQLWLRLREDQNVITDSVIDKCADVDAALADYYDHSIQRIVAQTGEVETRLRNGFERCFITPDRKRAPVRVIGKRTACDLDGSFIEPLYEKHLIRLTLSGEDGSWYELSHDRFIDAILRSNEAWRKLDADAQRYERLEQQAADWMKRDRNAELLLTGKALALAEAWLWDTYSSRYVPSDLAQEFVETSKHVETKKRHWATIAWLVVLAAVVAVAAGVIVWNMKTSRARERRASQVAMSSVESQNSRSMLDQAKIPDALASAVLAVSKTPDVELPPQARQSLLEAISASRQAVWLPRRNETLSAVRLSRNGSRVLTLTPREICVWRTSNGKNVFCESQASGVSWRAADFSPRGSYVWAIATDAAERLTLWGVPSGTKSKRTFAGAVTAISDDDRYIAVAQFDRLRLYRTDAQAVVATVKLPDVHAVVFAHHGRFLVAAEERQLTVREIPSLRLVRTIPIGSAFITDIELSSDDRYTAMKAWPFKHLLLIDLHSRRVRRPEDATPESRLAFVNGDHDLALLAPAEIRYVDVATGAVRDALTIGEVGTTFLRHTFVVKVAPNADDLVVRVYPADSHSRPVRVLRNSAALDDLDVSADARQLVTSSGSVARIWNLANGETFAPPLEYQSTTSLKKLACDELRRLYSQWPSSEVAAACSRP
jgi:hypothetical protein